MNINIPFRTYVFMVPIGILGIIFAGVWIALSIDKPCEFSWEIPFFILILSAIPLVLGILQWIKVENLEIERTELENKNLELQNNKLELEIKNLELQNNKLELEIKNIK